MTADRDPKDAAAGGGEAGGGLGAARDLLDGAGVAYEVVEHGETFTAIDEARATGHPPGRTAKTVVTTEAGTARLAVVPAGRMLDVERLRAVLGAGQHLRLATEEEIAAAFPAFAVGAIPPLGRLLGVETIIDPLVLHGDEVVIAGGDHAHSLVVDPQRLADAAGARIADICVHLAEDHAHRFADAPL